MVNAVLSPGSGSEAFRGVWAERLLPALEAFAPELLILSAGFDAHRADPLAQLRLALPVASGLRAGGWLRSWGACSVRCGACPLFGAGFGATSKCLTKCGESRDFRIRGG